MLISMSGIGMIMIETEIIGGEAAAGVWMGMSAAGTVKEDGIATGAEVTVEILIMEENLMMNDEVGVDRLKGLFIIP